MSITPEQRNTISANCLSSSWQALGPVLQRAHCPPTATPDVVVDWLASSHHRSQAVAKMMLQSMSQRIWRIDAATAPGAPTSTLLPLQVSSGGQRWTLWLHRLPELGLEQIST